MKQKYGEFSIEQIQQTKKSIRGSIFFLLLCVDNNTKNNYQNVNIEQCFSNLLYKLGGLNEVLFYPQEIVSVISILQAALQEYNKEQFSFKKYRKLILDAGAEVLKIREE